MENNVRGPDAAKVLEFCFKLICFFHPPSIPVSSEVNMLIVYYDHVYQFEFLIKTNKCVH